MIVQTIKTTPEWIGKNWKTIFSIVGTVWTIIVFLSGWFTGVNATVENFPIYAKKTDALEVEFKAYNTRFETFFELYKLDVSGRRSEAREIVKHLGK